MAGAVVLNDLLYTASDALKMPIFLDTIFTIAIAACFGAWPGVAVGFATNLLQEVTGGFPGYFWPFGFVNVASALVTAFMVRKGYADSLIGAFLIIVVLTLVNSFLGAFIVTLVFGGITDQPVDMIVRSLLVTGQGVFSSAFLGRVFINVVDKGIAVLVMLPIYRRCRRAADAGEP